MKIFLLLLCPVLIVIFWFLFTNENFLMSKTPENNISKSEWTCTLSGAGMPGTCTNND